MSIALKNTKEGSLLSAVLLIAGCCVGAGMIGLPVMSAVAGFIPSTLAMILCYGFATGTGLLLLEATLWFDRKVNLISIAHFALGRVGRVVTVALFLFLFYCIFVAYISGGGQLFSKLLTAVLQRPVSREIGIVACVVFVAAIVYGGTRRVSLLNRLFLIGTAVSYFALVSLGIGKIQPEPLLHMNWMGVLSTIPILLICFGYQNLIPTLTEYVKRNVSVLRKAIFIGNLIPFGIYFLWNFVILGLLQDSTLSEGIGQTEMVTGLLQKASASQSVLFFAEAFSFFALLTPFMANTLAFVDFFKDGFKMDQKSKYEFLIYGLVLIPPMLVTFLFPHLFLKALGFAGGFVDVVLFGVLPAAIVYVGRYFKGVEGPYKVAGGKPFLILILALSIGFLFLRG